MYDNIRYKSYGSIDVVLSTMVKLGMFAKSREGFHRSVYDIPENMSWVCSMNDEILHKLEKAYFNRGNKLFTSKSKNPTSGITDFSRQFIEKHSQSFDKFVVMDIKTKTFGVFTPMGNQLLRVSYDCNLVQDGIKVVVPCDDIMFRDEDTFVI